MPAKSPLTTSQAHRARVGGSALTLYRWDFGTGPASATNDFFTLCRQVTHQPPAPVGQGTVAIHPMDRQYPLQLVTPQAQSMGTLILEFYEPVDSPFWWLIPGMVKPVDLVDMFIQVAATYGGANGSATGKGVDVSKYMIDPSLVNANSQQGYQGKQFSGAGGGNNFNPTISQAPANYIITYHSAVISALDDSESVDVTTMEITKRITLNYTHWTIDNTG